MRLVLPSYKYFLPIIISLMFAIGISYPISAQNLEQPSDSKFPYNIEPEERIIIQSVLSLTMKGIQTSELSNQLIKFGLTEKTVGDIVSSNLEDAFSQGVKDLGRDLVFNFATDVVAESFADIMMNSVYAEKLPNKLKNPLRAMLRATVQEGFGVAEAVIVDSGTVGPFALVFPVIDRIEDVKKIHAAAKGTVQDRNATIMSAALGAEINAELLSKYPSSQSTNVANQWLIETKNTLQTISNPEEFKVLSAMLEDGFNALTAIQKNSCDSECESILNRLRSFQSSSSNDSNLYTPIENSLRLLGGYAPEERLAQGLIELTSLQQTVDINSNNQSSSTSPRSTLLSLQAEVPLKSPLQKARRQEICRKFNNSSQVVTGSRMVTEVNGLQSSNRMVAINCMRRQQSFEIKASDLLQLTYGLSGKQKRVLICSFKNNLPVTQSAQSLSGILGNLSFNNRAIAIGCLQNKLKKKSLSVEETLLILGSLVPEQYDNWDRTLADYRPSDHRQALCHLSPYLTGKLTTKDVSTLLGQSRNKERRNGIRCVRHAISHGLTWEEVDTILGPSLYYRGEMINLLEERTPDGLNARKLSSFMKRYRGSRYLNDPDPPGWLNGQCIAFARLAYKEVSDNPLTMQFGQASNIINRTSSSGFVTETDPKKARVGSLVVWNDGGAGHVGVVVRVIRDGHTGFAKKISIAESNWGIATNRVTKTWGISLEDAKRELVSDRYGYFNIVTLRVNSLDRPPPRARKPLSYKFIGYVLP